MISTLIIRMIQRVHLEREADWRLGSELELVESFPRPCLAVSTLSSILRNRCSWWLGWYQGSKVDMRTRKVIKVGKHNFYQLQQTVGHSFHESVTSFDDYNTERTFLEFTKVLSKKIKRKGNKSSWQSLLCRCNSQRLCMAF